MGGKSSNNFQRDRPESGGADRDDIREKSGILDREKEDFAQRDAERRRAKPAPNDESGESTEDRDEPYSAGESGGRKRETSGKAESPTSDD